ncbi:hypothetical protein SPURM210S_01107 [Streptomyces purpurascens]
MRAGTAVALVVSKGSPIDIPDVTGADEADARAQLQDAGLKVKIATERVNSSEFDKGQVAQQTPKAGGRAAEGDTVTLTLSKGPEMIEVPDVVGDSVRRGHASAGGRRVPGRRGPRTARPVRRRGQGAVRRGWPDRAQGFDDHHQDQVTSAGREYVDGAGPDA